MKLPESRAAVFLERVNRFAARARLADQPVLVHVPHRGRLGELLQAGAVCRVAAAAPNRPRKTAYDLLMVRHGARWVVIDARWANAVVADALTRGALPAFRGWPALRREVRVGAHRLDFGAENGQARWYVEVKCVTLVEHGTARFPDAPTSRGTEHLRLLTELATSGAATALLFVIPRSDAEVLVPHARHDPAFAAALAEARQAGVLLQAWTSDVGVRTMRRARRVPVCRAGAR